MADAFISYRRKPSAALAQLVQEKLKNHHNIDAYVDATRMDSTRVQFPERLMQAIADAPVFICLLGEGTLDSEWVHKEIERAHELQKRCIPVFQESYTPPPATDSAVEYLLRFDGVHILDVKSIFVDEAIAQIAARSAPGDSPTPHGTFPLRSVLIGVGALVLFGVVVSLFMFRLLVSTEASQIVCLHRAPISDQSGYITLPENCDSMLSVGQNITIEGEYAEMLDNQTFWILVYNDGGYWPQIDCRDTENGTVEKHDGTWRWFFQLAVPDISYDVVLVSAPSEGTANAVFRAWALRVCSMDSYPPIFAGELPEGLTEIDHITVMGRSVP